MRYLRYWFDTAGDEERHVFLAGALRQSIHPDEVDWVLGATEEELDRVIGPEGLERLARDLRMRSGDGPATEVLVLSQLADLLSICDRLVARSARSRPVTQV